MIIVAAEVEVDAETEETMGPKVAGRMEVRRISSMVRISASGWTG